MVIVCLCFNKSLNLHWHQYASPQYHSAPPKVHLDTENNNRKNTKEWLTFKGDHCNGNVRIHIPFQVSSDHIPPDQTTEALKPSLQRFQHQFQTEKKENINFKCKRSEQSEVLIKKIIKCTASKIMEGNPITMREPRNKH